MIRYKDSRSNEVIEYISKLTKLTSEDENVIGTVLFPFYDDTNNFDLLIFSKEDTPNHIVVTSFIGENRVQLIRNNYAGLKRYAEDIKVGTILYDRDGTLETIAADKDESLVYASNQLSFDDDFLIRLKLSINEKIKNSKKTIVKK